MESDISVGEINLDYEAYKLRTPLKFGSVIVDESVSLIVRVLVKRKGGGEAIGFGSMPLACEWAFPDPTVEYHEKLEAMKLVAEEYARVIERGASSSLYLHPIDWFMKFESEIPIITGSVSRELKLKAPLPILASLVAVSPIDAAIHDGFGKVNGVCSYEGYGPKYVRRDLGYYLGPRFKGKYISDYIKPRYELKMPVFHLVGGLDKLTKDEVGPEDPKDGLPVSLEEWIERDGIFCFKIKLTGIDLEWDVKRTKDVASVVREKLKGAFDKSEYYFSVDFNEMHKSPGETLEYLVRIKREDPETFERILYVEQPVSRDLPKYRFHMDTVAAVKPVLADEGVTDINSFDLALNLGWSGVALKTCKCHSSALLLVAKSEEFGVPYSVQDLTCPGLSLVHSAGFASRINPIKGFEYNARQYLPSAFPDVQRRYREIFEVRGGFVKTDILNGTLGLGLSL
jgi:L-alanine-DL-glutamate epimerase-like enolase superfamily enzyme